MSERILLIESFQVKVPPNILKENLAVCGDYIQFPALPLDTETGNGRIYSTPEIVPAIDCSNKLLSEKKIVLRCTADGHPPEEVPEPANASHKIIESWIENGYVWCKAKILPTSRGNDLRGLISEGDLLGISVRGTGTLRGKYVSEYEYMGADFVGIPSTGLMVLPESLKVVKSVKENLEKSSNKILNNNKEISSMKSITLNDLKALISESKSEVLNTKSKIDKSSTITMTESDLRGVTSVDFSGSRNGLSEFYAIMSDWKNLKESVENEDSNSNSNKKEDEDNEDNKSEQLATEKPNTENSTESDDLVEKSAELTESLSCEKQKVSQLKTVIINLTESKEFLKTRYDNLLKKYNSANKNLVSESLKNKSLKQIQESQNRIYQKNLNNQKMISEKLASDNLKLIKESDNGDMVKIAAAYKQAANEAVHDLLLLKFGKREK